MDIWTNLNWVGKGLQIAAAIGAGGMSLVLLKTAPRRIRWFTAATLWVLAVGFVLELWYETHLLQS